MATRAMNVKLEESKINDLKSISTVFHITMTDALNEALDSYLAKMKKDPFYRLTVTVEDASAEESKEILDEINSLTDDDLMISKVEKISL